jgi:hypothetical protein
MTTGKAVRTFHYPTALRTSRQYSFSSVRSASNSAREQILCPNLSLANSTNQPAAVGPKMVCIEKPVVSLVPIRRLMLMRRSASIRETQT